jgi:hypothetical protein
VKKTVGDAVSGSVVCGDLHAAVRHAANRYARIWDATNRCAPIRYRTILDFPFAGVIF